MKILVCGGRDYGDPWKARFDKTQREQYLYIQTTLTKLSCTYSKEYREDGNWLPTDIIIINGGARGADRASTDWAVCSYAQFKEYKADWDKYKKAAGFIRNQQMLDEEDIDLVVAFPGGNGTADMVRRAKKAGVQVIEVCTPTG